MRVGLMTELRFAKCAKDRIHYTGHYYDDYNYCSWKNKDGNCVDYEELPPPEPINSYQIFLGIFVIITIISAIMML